MPQNVFFRSIEKQQIQSCTVKNMKKAIEKLSYIIKQSKIKSLYHRGFLRCKENCNKLIIGVNPVPAAIKHICDTSCS